MCQTKKAQKKHTYIWSNYSDLTRPGPQIVDEEGKSPYFKKIQVGEI